MFRDNNEKTVGKTRKKRATRSLKEKNRERNMMMNFLCNAMGKCEARRMEIKNMVMQMYFDTNTAMPNDVRKALQRLDTGSSVQVFNFADATFNDIHNNDNVYTKG